MHLARRAARLPVMQWERRYIRTASAPPAAAAENSPAKPRQLFPNRSANKLPKGNWGRPPLFGNWGNGNWVEKETKGNKGNKGNKGFTGPKGNKGNKGPKGSPAPPPPPAPAKSNNMRYKQLKEKLKAIQNWSRRSENNVRELRQLIRQRDSYMHRFSSIHGTPTNYYNRNFHRFYRLPSVHRGLAQYYYYQQPGVPRYVQQLPAQVWRINQGGRGLPPVPFYPIRRQARRAPRRGR
jgi:hypothetical protein